MVVRAVIRQAVAYAAIAGSTIDIGLLICMRKNCPRHIRQ